MTKPHSTPLKFKIVKNLTIFQNATRLVVAAGHTIDACIANER